MTKNKLKFNISIIAILICVLLITLALPLLTFAETGSVDDATGTGAQCTSEMRVFMKEKSTEMRTYLEQHFQSKNSNSTLLQLAMERFKKYKMDLREKLSKYSPRAGLDLYTEILGASQCANEVDNEIANMEIIFKQYFVETSELKATSMLQTKLAEMNKKLRELSINIGSMYGKWQALKERVPCFVNKCISG